MPAVIKPAPQTAYLTEAMFREMLASGLLPEGAVQLISGDAVDFLPHLQEQDVLTFTGSAATGKKLKSPSKPHRQSGSFYDGSGFAQQCRAG